MRAISPPDWTFVYPSPNSTWVDRLAQHLFRWLDASLVRQTAGEVARECHFAAWSHLYPKVNDLNLTQARGYVRAVVPGFIAREIDAVLSRRRVSLSLRQRVMAEATEQLIELIADDVLCTQPSGALLRAQAA